MAWRRTDVEGLALGRLSYQDGWQVDAHEVVVGRSSYAIYYGVELSNDWRTRYVTIGVSSRALNIGTSIEVDFDARVWWVSGRRRRALDGCIDIDIAASPMTNTIPIRRLGLSVGHEAVIRVAWLDVPSLRVIPVEQTYRRLGRVEGQPGVEAWEYGDSAHGRHRITVDEDGLVIDYEGFAERIGPRRA